MAFAHDTERQYGILCILIWHDVYVIPIVARVTLY